MQSSHKPQQTTLNNHVLQQLLTRTKDQLHPCYKKHKSKLPPILHSKDMFMLHLIQEESSTNKDLISHVGKISQSGNHSGRGHSYNINSAPRLVERPPKLLFDKETPHKVKYKNIPSSPSELTLSSPYEKQTITLANGSTINQEQIRSILKRDSSSFLPQSNTNVIAQLSQRSDKSQKKYLSPKKQVRALVTLEAQTIKEPIHAIRPFSLEKSKMNSHNQHRFRRNFSKQHVKTCTDETLSKIHVSKYSILPSQLNFHTKRDRKTKMAFTKPIESSILLNKEFTPTQRVNYFSIEEQLEPWSSQYPLEFDFMPN